MRWLNFKGPFQATCTSLDSVLGSRLLWFLQPWLLIYIVFAVASSGIFMKQHRAKCRTSGISEYRFFSWKNIVHFCGLSTALASLIHYFSVLPTFLFGAHSIFFYSIHKVLNDPLSKLRCYQDTFFDQLVGRL